MSESPLHQSALHESGYKHASGEARYVDDLPKLPGQLFAQAFCSSIPRGRIKRLDVSAARALPGVHAVLTAEDIPGINDIAPFTHDEPLLAKDEVYCVGQHIALIVAESYARCRAAAAAIELQMEPLEAVLSLREAIKDETFLTTPHVIKRGDVEAALSRAHLCLEGEVETGGQDHFYLETQAALVVPGEDDGYHVYSSTQHPTEVQAKVAEVLGIGRFQVVVETARMGGGFGGKETQGAHFAAMAALGARATGRPVRMWLNRDQDMVQTGKRHPFYSKYRAGFDEEGKIVALEVFAYSDGGWCCDLSGAILDRCLFHLDNAYYVPDLYLSGRVARTHRVSNTAFRGFGGPQGVVVIEKIMSRAARSLGMTSAQIRRRNFYREAPANVTPYGQPVLDNRLHRIYDELMERSAYTQRAEEIAAFNQRSRFMKRGIAFSPVKFGISFTNAVLNQAGALVLIYADGSVQVNHGGTEMGQGLFTKMLAVAAHELGIGQEKIRMMHTATDKVPNTSATAASSGSDLNGQAVKVACETLRGRLAEVAARMLELPVNADLARVRFSGGKVFYALSPERKLTFEAVVQQAYLDQVSLSSTGFYRTPDIQYDRERGQGKPFHYYAFGGAVTEVEVNGLTGEHRVLRVDILHDVGNSLIPSIDIGQVEGAYIQGLGWLTCEELVWGAGGDLRTHSPDTYKIPAMGEAPPDFRVSLLQRAPQPEVIHGSKAVGEPPFMLAISAMLALEEAVTAYGSGEGELAVPCTPEALLAAIERRRTGATERAEAVFATSGV